MAADDPYALVGKTETAILTGKLHYQFSCISTSEGLEASACRTDFRTFLAACSVEQKRLEHVALHLFTLPSTSLSEEHHAQAIWSLLSSIEQLSETFEQSFDTFSTTSTAFTNSQAALLKNKIGVQLYGIFPRLLFSFGERKGRHDRWLFNAVTLAGAALSMYHAAWSQSGWLGDHSLDALTFTDLLAGYVHIRAYETTEAGRD